MSSAQQWPVAQGTSAKPGITHVEWASCPHRLRSRCPRAHDGLSRWFDVVLILPIPVNVVAVILESVVALRLRWAFAFSRIETFSVVAFCAE